MTGFGPITAEAPEGCLGCQGEAPVDAVKAAAADSRQTTWGSLVMAADGTCLYLWGRLETCMTRQAKMTRCSACHFGCRNRTISFAVVMTTTGQLPYKALGRMNTRESADLLQDPAVTRLQLPQLGRSDIEAIALQVLAADQRQFCRLTSGLLDLLVGGFAIRMPFSLFLRPPPPPFDGCTHKLPPCAASSRLIRDGITHATVGILIRRRFAHPACWPENSGGLPLHTTELCRWLDSKSMLDKGSNGVIGLREKVQSGALRPPSLDAIIGTKIDQLPPRVSVVLKLACIQGYSFDVELLHLMVEAELKMDMGSLLALLCDLGSSSVIEMVGEASNMWQVRTAGRGCHLCLPPPYCCLITLWRS